MPDTTILKDITQAFIEKVKANETINDGDAFERFLALFNDDGIPTVEQLKQALFNEELS